MKNSFNKNPKGYCDVKHDGTDPVTRKTGSTAWNSNKWYNNKVSPTSSAPFTPHQFNPSAIPQNDCETNDFVWFEVALSDVIDVPYPVCTRTGYSRENQLGNSLDPVVDLRPKKRLAEPQETQEALEAQPHFLNANRHLPSCTMFRTSVG